MTESCSYSFGAAISGMWDGGSCNTRFVLKPDIAIASEVSISSKSSLAITDFLAKKTQLVNCCANPLLETTPFAIPNNYRAFVVPRGSARTSSKNSPQAIYPVRDA